MINVVIPEPIPSLNKGEAAILRGIQEALAMLGDVNLSVYSPACWYEVDSERYGNNINVVSGVDLWDLGNLFSKQPVHRTRMHFFKTWGKLISYSILYRMIKLNANKFVNDDLLKTFGKSDLIIVGHDGMFTDDHFWVVLAAKIMKKPISVYGSGTIRVGRSKRLKVRKFVQYIINNSILCTVRDESTKKYLVDNDVNANLVHVFPDPAVLLKPCDAKHVENILEKENIPDNKEIPIYGLIPVIGGVVFDNSFSDEKDLTKKHELRVQLWVELVNHLLSITNAHFVFIPHCIGPTSRNDDRRMSKNVYDLLGDGKNRVTLMENEYSEGELKGLMNRCDFILGERTHGLIGAFSVATPLIALTVKEDYRMRYIIDKMFKRVAIDLNVPDIDNIKSILAREWTNRKEIQHEMEIDADKVLKDGVRAANLLKDKFESYVKQI